MRYEDLTGNRYGKLVALSSEEGKYKVRYWLCKCDCGNYCKVNSRYLQIGQVKSCGCMRKGVRPGERYGRLTVLSLTNKRSSNGARLCHCICDCGKECDVNMGSIKSGLTKSCGCLHVESAIQNGKKVSVDLTGQRFGRLQVLYKTEKKQGTNIVWMCRCDCGTLKEFSTGALRGDGVYSCGCVQSKGEYRIASILSKNNISFQKQYKVKIWDRYYFFDFIVTYNGLTYLIEYDGAIHYKAGGWNTEERLKDCKVRDDIKTSWCIENDIPLIRIPYTYLDVICEEDLIPITSRFLIRSEDYVM